MVLKKDSARAVLDLMGARHRSDDPDDEFLDRLAKKTSFYEQPSAPPEGLNPPDPERANADELDALANVVIDDGGAEPAAPPSADAAAAAAAHARSLARYSALYDGRSGGGSDQTSAPELPFERLSARPGGQELPSVGKAALHEDEEAAAEQAQEDEERRAAWRELNRLRDEKGQASEHYRMAHDRFVATYGHRGVELKE